MDRELGELDEAVEPRSERTSPGTAADDAAGRGPDHLSGFCGNIGDVSRFQHSNQVASYLGLIPREHRSGGKQRLGAITKQGNRFLRQLLVESVQTGEPAG